MSWEEDVAVGECTGYEVTFLDGRMGVRGAVRVRKPRAPWGAGGVH